MMRIESAISSPVSPLLPLNQAQQSPLATTKRNSLEISATGRLFSSGQQALATLPPVRDDQVRQFQTLLSSGQYRADVEACASAMLSGQEAVNHAGSLP
ncbi:MAG: flagellar biosynthesis anti-sigma factor FlgM [Bacteroidota bacterium]